MESLFTEKGKLIVLGDPITDERGVKGEGGEGIVYLLSPSSKIPNYNQYVAKIYKKIESVSDEQEKKLQRLLQIGQDTTKQLKGICFPKHLLYKRRCGKKNKCVGFLMTYYKGDVLGQSILSPYNIKRSTGWTRIELAILANSILKRFKSLHDVGILVGDINPDNIIIDNSGTPFFIDVDSFQVEDYPCPVCRIEFISQRLVNELGNSNVMRNIEDEYYAIAVLLFMIFLVGKHPYAKRGRDSVEKNLRDRNFIYPMGYDDKSNIIPRGPYQRIWYNLPRTMRKAFYDVFHDAKSLSPEKWKNIISQYKNDLIANRYPRNIFPENEESKGSRGYLEQREQANISPNPTIYRNFETIISNDYPKTHYVFLEFGTNIFRGFESRGLRTVPGCRDIKTHHFSFVDNGRMDAEQLVKALLHPQCLPQWESYIKNFTPKYTHMFAFGTSLLRNLSNKREVIDTIKNATKYSIGILSLEEEAEMLIAKCGKMMNAPKEKSIFLIDVGGCTTSLMLKSKDGVIKAEEFLNMGKRVLYNRFLNTASSDSRLLTMFENHDNIILEQFKNYWLEIPEPVEFFGAGVFKKMSKALPSIKSNKDKRVFTLEELEMVTAQLTNDLTVNRSIASVLFNDIDSSQNENLTIKIEVRLCLPVYTAIMKRFGIEKISIISLDAGRIYVSNMINKLEQK